MGQPITPPGDIPLFEGLGTEWNDIVGALPEDRRAELAPRIKERLDTYTPLKQWEEFNRSGITPEQASTALNVYRAVENNPRETYEAIGKALGITPQQAKQVTETVQDEIDNGNDDPRIVAMQNQLNTMAGILLGQHQNEVQSQQDAEADAWLDSQLNDLKKKYSDVDEREIVMRMIHLDMTPEEAYNDYNAKVTQLRSSRPAPMIMSGGGVVPRNAIDPTKLNNSGTKDLVVQMIQAAQNESRS